MAGLRVLCWEGVSSQADFSDAQKVTFCANCLLSNMVNVLRVVGASFKTFHSRIPSLSEAASDRSICGLVSSLKI